jgi:hypothetical protein
LIVKNNKKQSDNNCFTGNHVNKRIKPMFSWWPVGAVHKYRARQAGSEAAWMKYSYQAHHMLSPCRHWNNAASKQLQRRGCGGWPWPA